MIDSKAAREAINKIKDKSEDDFEKHIIYIASGALAISFSFIERLVPLDKSISKWMLIFSWILFALTLVINLLSHYYCKHLAEKSIDEIDDNDPNIITNITKRNKRIDAINYFSITTLFAGLLFLIFFVSVNINHMSDRNTKPDRSTDDAQTRGRTIPKPQQISPQNDPKPKPDSNTSAPKK